nr:MAG TPA: hypothetical protein [Caudoviricetes sp.]
METVRDALRGELSNFPVPEKTLLVKAARRGLDLDGEASPETLKAASWWLTVADLYRWLLAVANISQGGQSFTFTAEDKRFFRSEANRIYSIYGTDEDEILADGVKYGYKGENL